MLARADEKQSLSRSGRHPGAAKNPNAGALNPAHIPGLFSKNHEGAFFRALIDGLSEGVVVVDRRLNILYANEAFCRMARAVKKEVAGRLLGELLQTGRNVTLRQVIRQALADRACIEGSLVNKRGREVRIMFSVCAIRSKNRLLFGVSVTDLSGKPGRGQDSGDQDEASRQKDLKLSIAHRDLASLTFVLGHHLREPIRKIQTFVNLINDSRPAFSESCDFYFSRIMDAAERMQDLISDILDYCEAGQGGRELAGTDLNTILRETQDDVARSQKRDVVINFEQRLPVVKAVPFQMRQLFRHLLINSAKFCPKERPLQVTIRCHTCKGEEKYGLMKNTKYHRISVIDNGMGFDAKYTDRIFEVFQKLNRPGEFSGTGIGLAVCRRVAENHNGAIVARSKSGQGARFDVFLPGE